MNIKRNKYYTGYLPLENEEFTELEYTGKYFYLTFDKPHKDRDCNNNYELVTYTNNIQSAYKVQELLLASLYLDGSNLSLFTGIEPILIPAIKTDYYNEEREHARIYASFLGIPRIVKIATKCSFSKSLIYSLLKYKLACSLHSNEIFDLDPYHSDYVPLNKYLPSDHIRMGYAIVLFYSVIEELGLEIRADNRNPSTINGAWNRAIKTELENRLKKKGIDISQLYSWNLRSTPTIIEKNKKLINIKSKSKWSGYSIRDSDIEIVDAIRILSWIRSRVVSHKLNKSIDSISIYDVANAMFLARRLFLEKIKLWKR